MGVEHKINQCKCWTQGSVSVGTGCEITEHRSWVWDHQLWELNTRSLSMGIKCEISECQSWVWDHQPWELNARSLSAGIECEISECRSWAWNQQVWVQLWVWMQSWAQVRSHWGQRGSYLAGVLWVCSEFLNNLPTLYPVGKCWVFSKLTHHFDHNVPCG